MKKIVLILVAAMAVVSCGTQSRIPKYDIVLSSVESRADNNVVDLITSVQEDGVSQYVYEDDYIRILWFVDRVSFHFNLENKTDRTIRVEWDNIAYVDYDGETGRVIHSGVKYNERNSEQAPSVVPRRARMTDVLLPAANVEFDGYRWQEKSLLGGDYGWVPTGVTTASSLVDYSGKSMSIVMPLEIDGQTREYTFNFIVRNNNE